MEAPPLDPPAISEAPDYRGNKNREAANTSKSRPFIFLLTLAQ